MIMYPKIEGMAEGSPMIGAIGESWRIWGYRSAPSRKSIGDGSEKLGSAKGKARNLSLNCIGNGTDGMSAVILEITTASVVIARRGPTLGFILQETVYLDPGIGVCPRPDMVMGMLHLGSPNLSANRFVIMETLDPGSTIILMLCRLP